MDFENDLMSQLVFKFPFTTKYYEQDFFVSENNFSAYKLIESWPAWPGKWLNIYGTSGSANRVSASFSMDSLHLVGNLLSGSAGHLTARYLYHNRSECRLIVVFDQKIHPCATASHASVNSRRPDPGVASH